jgi:threonylcarbamoyladenosine tRNA methylthiotransferase MtaB
VSALEVITFGCRLNRFEAEVARSQAQAAGLGDAVIVNTCAVTAEAERQARQAIRRARRQRPGARIIVTGCAAQLRPEVFAAMPEVDAVLGNAEKLEAACYGAITGASVQVADIMAVHETAGHLISGLEGRSRAFVQVQQGCDHRCTFCVIPYARGPSRSVPPEHAVEQVRRLVANGHAEVVLTGVDITAYGEDLSERPTLGALVRRLLADVPELKRLRLSSLDVAEVDAELMAAIAEEERLMPHLHLSLQAGDDLVLKRMKRRHSRAQAIEFCEAVRRLRPDVTFGADLIAGFPTESAAMFGRTVELVADCGLTYLHVFPYSSREGTPAARMPQVPVPERKVRAAALRAAGSEALDGFLHSRTGSTESVLAEDSRRGRTEQFAPIELDAEVSPGSVVSARVTGVAAGALSATPLPSARR